MRSSLFCLLFSCLLFSRLAHTQEMSPRAYWPAPTGTQVLTLGATHTTGDIVPDPSLPLTGLDSDITVGYVGYLRTLNLFGRSSNLILEVPYADGSTESEHFDLGLINREYKGIGDIGVTLSLNLLGAPAMDIQGFAQLRADPKPIVGVSLKVVAPTGDYEDDKLINVGANRWATKLEVGSMLVLHRKWLLEFEVGAWMFADNDDFIRGLTKEQAPLYSAELHLVRRFAPGFWASLDLNAYKGGRSKVEGMRLNDLQRDSALGATLVFPFAKGQAIKASYITGSVNDSDESFDIYQLSYQRLF
jgi:Putative MetA-pathway of phenol degradation